MPNYHAITIGPIYQTFRNARQTREVWGASFLFSYLAKGLIVQSILPDFKGKNYSKLSENEINSIISKTNDFVLPNISEAELFKPKSGVGLFPDRIIFKSDLLKGTDFQAVIKKVIKTIAKEITAANNTNSDEVESYLNQYFRIDFVEQEVDEKKNPIIEISPYLNTLELTPQFVSKVKANPLTDFLYDVNSNGFLERNYSAEDSNGNVRFESLVEICTRELKYEPEYDINVLWDRQFRKNKDYVELKGTKNPTDTIFLEKLGKKLKTYHKYICIVKADGDKIGATINDLDAVGIVPFSKKLLDWGLKVKDKIRDYGGVPIYVGGDDLLFFAPVSNGKKHIFDLIKTIDKEFKDQDWSSFSTQPSISYGLSLTYYKFPLGEAIEEAGNLLYEAKSVGGDAIALRLMKHSGNEFGLVLKKSEDTYKVHFEQILAKMVDDASFLNSVGYKLRDNQELLKLVADDSSRLESLFHNVFDERKEKRQASDEYLLSVRTLLNHSFQQQNKNIEPALKEVFSIIRTSKFIKGLEEVK